MPKSVLSPKRSLIARIAVLAVVASLLAVAAVPASAHSVAIDTSVSCPSNTPSGGFTDIGGFDATTQTAINCLKAFGITVGTTATTYSPNETVTRWQMALFLVRQAADHQIAIPAASPQGYSDIGGLPQATQDAINQVTQLGISKGTSTTTFSPNDAVTRWQMALFLRRLAVLAGVTVTDDPAHNQFSDIGAYTAEIQAAINYLADGHMALGTGGSLYSGNDPVLRWQMALFLTRVLAADGVTQVGLRVAVTPTDTLNLGIGQARTYTATFKNADGTVYTGRFGVQLVEASSGLPVYNDVADFIVIEASSDAPGGIGTAEINGVAGSDGIVTFTVRNVLATAEDAIPVAWEDLDLDNSYESTGNNQPTEPFGLGGVSNFVAGPLSECSVALGSGVFAATKTEKAADRYEANGCSLFYDSNDIFTVDGSAASLQEFEDALSVGDVVTVTYDPDTADQSNFSIPVDGTAPLTVTDPAAATTVDAATYAIKGTGDPGATIRIRQDVNNDGIQDVGDNIVATGTADVDGVWTVVTPLAQGVANDFLASQLPAFTGATEVGTFDVPRITEGASAGATIISSGLAEGGTGGEVDPFDVITIVFSEPTSGVGSGDTISLVDTAGHTGTITCGTNATCTVNATAETLTVAVNAVIPVVGGAVNSPTTITGVAGFTDDDGEAINVAGSGAARTFFH